MCQPEINLNAETHKGRCTSCSCCHDWCYARIKTRWFDEGVEVTVKRKYWNTWFCRKAHQRQCENAIAGSVRIKKTRSCVLELTEAMDDVSGPTRSRDQQAIVDVFTWSVDGVASQDNDGSGDQWLASRPQIFHALTSILYRISANSSQPKQTGGSLPTSTTPWKYAEDIQVQNSYIFLPFNNAGPRTCLGQQVWFSIPWATLDEEWPLAVL